MMRSPLQRVLVGVFATALAAAACGRDEQVVGAGQSSPPGAEFAQEVGACPGAPPEGADPFQFVATPGAWLRLNEVSSTADSDLAGAAFIRAGTELVGGDAAAVEAWESQSESLHATTSMARLTEEASSLGLDVYAKTGFDGDPNEVILVVAFQGDDFGFVGECNFERYTVPFRERFGDSATQVVRAIVGADSGRTAELMNDAPPPTARVPDILNPQYVDREILAGLEHAGFNIPDLPSSWIGPYTVCTRIDLGWSDCVDLSSDQTAAINVSAYIDPQAPKVEVWLLDEAANLLEPVAQLASISVPADMLGSPGDGRTVQLTLSLPADRSVDDAARNGDMPGEGVRVIAEELAE